MAGLDLSSGLRFDRIPRTGDRFLILATLEGIAAMVQEVIPESLNFDSIEMKRVTVKIGEGEYILQEADAEAGAYYEDAMIASVRMVDSKPVSVGNINQRDLVLLSMCLFVEETNDTGTKLRRVNRAFVMGLPMRISEPLIDCLKKMSGLEELGEALGEESDDTETNSE